MGSEMCIRDRAVEEGATLGWHRYVGDAGAVLGMESFGISEPISKLQPRFGFTAENVANTMAGLTG